MANDVSVTFRHSVNPYHSGYSSSLFLQEKEESPLKHQHTAFSGSSDVKPQKVWLLKGVCQVYFKLKFLKRESLPETLNFRNLL